MARRDNFLELDFDSTSKPPVARLCEDGRQTASLRGYLSGKWKLCGHVTFVGAVARLHLRARSSVRLYTGDPTDGARRLYTVGQKLEDGSTSGESCKIV